MIKLLLLIFCAFNASAVAKRLPAAPSIESEKQSVKALVEKAVDYYRLHGKVAAFNEISKKDGILHDHGLYVFVYDVNGTMCAHGQFAAGVGKNFLRARDHDGRLFIQERLDLVKDKGEGWQTYVYMNPATKKYATKTSYLKKIDDLYVFGSGFYGPDHVSDAAPSQSYDVLIACSGD